MTIKEEVTTVVIGGGPSGISAAGCLSFHSIPYLLLERDDCFASLWQKKAYDRLHLHLAKQTCQLPYFPIPTHWPKYKSKTQFIEYLKNYMTNFNIKPRYNTLVELVDYDEEWGGDKKWRVRAKNVVSGEVEEYRARFVVVASGESCDPFVPEIDGLESFQGKVMHSTEYKNGKEFKGKSVLVVGSGNSGMEIALDLANYGAITSIVVKSPMNILTREMLHWAVVLAKYLPFNWIEKGTMMLSRLVFGDMSKYGIPKPAEGPFTMKAKYGKFPIVDLGTCKKIRSREIQVLPAIASIRGNDVTFADGKSYPFDAIVFATGFKRTTNVWLQGDDYLLNEDGFARPPFPNNWKGKNGLYCVGLSRRGLFGAALDAQAVATDIKSLL